VNRMHPPFGPGSAADAHAAATKYAGTDLGPLWQNLADLRQLAAGEEAQIGGLASRVAPAPVVRVPVLHSDVHDLDGLAQVGSYLFGSGSFGAG
jgi:hypothetical protein